METDVFCSDRHGHEVFLQPEDRYLVIDALGAVGRDTLYDPAQLL